MVIALRKIRESKGIDAQDLGDKLGVSKHTIWSWERGNSQPDPEALCQLADALDVSLDLLVRGKEKDRPRGRSVQAILDEYKGMSSEEITLISYVLQTELANRAFQDHLRQDEKQNP